VVKLLSIYGVEQNIENQIVETVESIGYHFIECRALKSKIDDQSLQVVRGQSKDGSFATWIHNSISGGLRYGNYNLSYEESLENFHERE
jgi:hypothetical protein